MIDWYFVGIAASLVCVICAVIMTFVVIVMCRRQGAELEAVRGNVTQLQAVQSQYLTARNLGPIHEKINVVANNVAAMRAEHRGTNEQLKLITNYVMKNLQ